MTTTTTTLDLVVARYNEDLAFLNAPPFTNLSWKIIHLYNKGPPLETHHFQNLLYAPLPNVGREGHTYLHHLVEHYDHLADVTVFVPGSCMEQAFKERKVAQTLRRVAQTHDTVFYGFPIPGLETLAEFGVSHHLSSSTTNRQLNAETLLEPSPIRPFGAWYRRWIGEEVPLEFMGYNGIFAVSREQVHRHDRAYYRSFLELLGTSSNPEVGHYLERAWVALFHPVPVECLMVEKDYS